MANRALRIPDARAGAGRGLEGRGVMKGLTYDAGAAAYDSFTGRWSLAFAPTVLAVAGVTVGQTVLEVAAGTGGLTVMAASAVRSSGRVIATDLSLPMLRVGKGKITGLPVRLVVMDGQDLACRDRSFDVVICQLGLMFLPDPRRGLREFRRVLREHGRLAVQVWSRLWHQLLGGSRGAVSENGRLCHREGPTDGATTAGGC